MKKLFFVFILLAGIMRVNAQGVIERCQAELEPIIAQANAVWHEGNTHYGISRERSELYATYCLKACNVCDKYLNLITNENDQIDLMWFQVDILSDILDIYEDHKWGLKPFEYEQLFQRKVTLLDDILTISNRIDDKHTNLQEKFDVGYDLGEHYFKRKEYKQASSAFSQCIIAYQELIKRNSNDNELIKFGQKAYYWKGYCIYKLGDTPLANSYLNKAKNILNDSLIQPYK